MLNGKVSEEMAKYEAKALVGQLQSQKAHQRHSMVYQMNNEMAVADEKLLRAPIWFTHFDYKVAKTVPVLYANSGAIVNGLGLWKPAERSLEKAGRDI